MSKQARRKQDSEEVVVVEKTTEVIEKKPAKKKVSKKTVAITSEPTLEERVTENRENIIQLGEIVQKEVGRIDDHEDRVSALEKIIYGDQLGEDVSESEPEVEEIIETVETSPVDPDTPIPADSGEFNGPGMIFKYWNYKTKSYDFKKDIWAAKKAGNGVYEPIWVWFIDGKVDHILNSDEVIKYCP